jgi:hypothetical protein
MRSPKAAVALLALGAVVSACRDIDSPTAPPAFGVTQQASEGRGVFQRYVSIGTSVSMGWQSDGVFGEMQTDAWTAQLSKLAGRTMGLPRIAGPGCRAPLAGPLASGVRTSGEAAAQPSAQAACAPLLPGIVLPQQNVAINGATTLNALQTTPEANTDVFGNKLYSRVLPPGETQLTAALRQNPKFVSIELGANEVLPARSGVAIPGATIFPYAQWAPLYTTLVQRVAREVGRGLLVGLIEDVAAFPSFRRGAELYADRAALLGAFHVQVSADCQNSDNLLFVPVRVPTAVATGLAQRARSLPPFVLSCVDGGLGVQDFVLTPSEAAIVNSSLAEMTNHIVATAQTHRFAIMHLQSLYGRPDLKPPFSAVALMTTPQPYGQYISLDGIHPNALGHALLAKAAAQAINARYGYGIPTDPVVASR